MANNELLAKASRDYPVNTKYIGLNSSNGTSTEITYVNTICKPEIYNSDCVIVQGGKGIVYSCGKWAEIINEGSKISFNYLIL